MRLWSRNGKDFTTRFPEIQAALERQVDIDHVLDDELMVMVSGRSSFGALQLRNSSSVWTVGRPRAIRAAVQQVFVAGWCKMMDSHRFDVRESQSVVCHEGGSVRREVLTGAVAVSLLAGLLPVTPAGAADAAGIGVVSGRVAAGVDESVVAHGMVKTTSGKSAASVPVVLYAWPGNDVTEKMQVGDEATLQQLSETTAGADGSFQLKLTDLSALAPVTGPDGIVNFEIVAGEGESAVPFGFPRKVSTVAGKKTLIDAVADPSAAGQPEAPPLLSIDLAAGKIVDKTPVETAVVDGEPLAEGDEGFVKGCTVTLVESYGARWTFIGVHYNDTTKVTTDFGYVRDATSELGVGLSATGKQGSFKASGTMARSTNGSINFDTVGDFQDRYRKTQFRYGKYRVICTRPGGIPVPYYEARATAWVAASDSWKPKGSPKIDYANNCAKQQANVTVTMANTRAVTFSNGVTIGAEIGIELSSRTGYSRTSTVAYRFNASGRQLCGTTGAPGDEAPTTLLAAIVF
ncbi:hypothetical protein ACIA49_28600 [Kribbella sp. NPDC051587]|uniref:hypothetical protein n=1 Tax=Kribbella sp. NPDC051587 TaxID=3364119 RepID=UPI0037A35580